MPTIHCPAGHAFQVEAEPDQTRTVNGTTWTLASIADRAQACPECMTSFERYPDGTVAQDLRIAGRPPIRYEDAAAATAAAENRARCLKLVYAFAPLDRTHLVDADVERLELDFLHENGCATTDELGQWWLTERGRVLLAIASE